VDPNEAITVGMTAAQVGNQVRAALVAQPATSIQSTDGQSVSVIVQLDPEAVASVDELKALPVGTVAVVPLSAIAAVEEVEVQGSITRPTSNRPPITADLQQRHGAVSVEASRDTLEAAARSRTA
jgi:multidrug efflux pump subunit AcrB